MFGQPVVWAGVAALPAARDIPCVQAMHLWFDFICSLE